jgi:hypothetical protein
LVADATESAWRDEPEDVADVVAAGAGDATFR